MNNNLSLIKLINNASKTLNFINQLIPIYKKVQPMISKTQNYIAGINTTKQMDNSLPSKTSNTNNNQPTFFQ